MQDPANDIEVWGVKIKHFDLSQVQREMKNYSSVRFLYNPEKWKENDPYYIISYGGKSKDIRDFEAAIQKFIFYPPGRPKSWWKKMLGDY